MAVIAVRILFVGGCSEPSTAILTRLGRKGWGSYGVDTIQEAQTLMTTFKFDLVLALESLADGRGYDLAVQVAQESNSLLVAIALSESYLWLPVIYHGNQVMGERAINSEMVERELEEILAASDREHMKTTIHNSTGAAGESKPARGSRAKRRDVGLVTGTSSPSLPDPSLQAKRALLKARLSPLRAAAPPPDWLNR